MIYPEHLDYIRRIIRENTKKFPYIILSDPSRIVDEELLAGMEMKIVTYKDENDYIDIRLKAESAKKFELKPALFVLQHESSEEYFSDLYNWFERIDIDEKMLEYFSKITSQEITKPMTPLAALIFKKDLTNRLKEKWKKAEVKESSIDFLSDFFLSVLLDEDIFGAKNQDEKTARLFRVIFDPTKYEHVRDLLINEKSRSFVEKIFSVNKLIEKCLADVDLRKNICATILGLFCSSKLSDDTKNIVTSPLLERFETGRKEERKELCDLFDKVKPELESLLKVPIEPDLKSSIDKFVRDYEKTWFKDVNLQNASQLLSGILPFEFEWVKKSIEEEVKTLPSDVTNIRQVVGTLNSWIVASKEKIQNEIIKLNKLVPLLENLNLLPKEIPKKWEYWFAPENTLLKTVFTADYYLSMEMQYPTLNESEAWKTVSTEYRRLRSKFLEKYEEMLNMNYSDWISGKKLGPRMVKDVIDYIRGHLIDKYETIFLIVVDGMRLDFWDILKNSLEKDFKIIDEEKICSLIPSETPFSRVAIFSGKIPENFEDIDEPTALRKAFNLKSVALSEGKISNLLTLANEKLTDKVRAFIYYTAEFLHAYPQSLVTALEGFKDAVPEFVRHLKYVVGKARKPVVVITSDHGSMEISDPLVISLPSELKRKFWIESGLRCWIFTVRYDKPLRAYEREYFKSQIKKQIKTDLGDKVFIFEPEKLKLQRSDGTSRFRRGKRIRPVFVVIPRKYGFFSLEEKRLYSHGGLSFYETIVPFAILTPK